MEMRESGMAEGLAKLDAALADRARKAPGAWAAAVVTEQSDLLDAVAPGVPVKSGDLVGSGFVERETGVAGWGSDHAEKVHELDRGRGFKFHQRVVAERAGGVAARMAPNFDAYLEAGVTPGTARSSWPETPVTHPSSPSGRARRGARRRR